MHSLSPLRKSLQTPEKNCKESKEKIITEVKDSSEREGLSPRRSLGRVVFRDWQGYWVEATRVYVSVTFTTGWFYALFYILNISHICLSFFFSSIKEEMS
jgi:hypothetical protein